MVKTTLLLAQSQPHHRNHTQRHWIHMLHTVKAACGQLPVDVGVAVPTFLGWRARATKKKADLPPPPFTILPLHSTSHTTHTHHPCPSPHTTTQPDNARTHVDPREQPRLSPSASAITKATGQVAASSSPLPFFVAPRARAHPPPRNHGDPDHGQGRGVEEQRG